MGSLVPKSPCLVSDVFRYWAPAAPIGWPGMRPPALPHESIIGALPGARHGLKKV
eukprot:COSAG02_NODE_10390_length_1951_cov_1.954644_2_plen_55_part_00